MVSVTDQIADQLSTVGTTVTSLKDSDMLTEIVKKKAAKVGISLKQTRRSYHTYKKKCGCSGLHNYFRDQRNKSICWKHKRFWRKGKFLHSNQLISRVGKSLSWHEKVASTISTLSSGRFLYATNKITGTFFLGDSMAQVFLLPVTAADRKSKCVNLHCES